MSLRRLLLGWALLLAGLLCLLQAPSSSRAYWQSRAQTVIAATGGITIPTNLVGYWPMDTATTSGSTTNDINPNSVGPNNFTLAGGYTAGQAGQVAQAILFNGTTGNAATSAAVITGFPFTFSAWVKLTAATWTSGVHQIILGVVQKSSITEFWLSYFATGGSPAYQLNLVEQSGGSAHTAAATVTPDTGWHFIAATATNNTTGQQIYLDGTPLTMSYNGTANTPSSLDTTYASGIYYNTSTFYSPLNGLLDEGRIYNTNLSSGNVTTLDAAGVAGHP